VSVSCDDPPAFTDAGANVPVTPDGAPLSDKPTDCAEPEATPVFTVTAALEDPGAALAADGDVLIEKPAAAGAGAGAGAGAAPEPQPLSAIPSTATRLVTTKKNPGRPRRVRVGFGLRFARWCSGR
jgi:hypothetical protein